MKTIIRLVLLTSLAVVTSAAIAQDRCKDCDCTVYPVKPECAKCCGVATGVIQDFTASSVTVSRREGADTFTITQRTKVEGKAEKGASVRVVYQIKDKVAGLIQINPSS